MKENSYLWISINTMSYYYILNRLNELNINVYKIKSLDKKIIVKIKYSDFSKLKKYLFSYDIKIVDSNGIYKYKNIVKKQAVFILSVICSIAFLLLCNSVVFKVDVKTSNKYIKNIIINEIKKYKIGKMSLKKSHNKIEKIVKEIRKNNKDDIEWLEIKYEGLVMIVNVTERTKEIKEEKHDYCNLIAKKDSKIMALNVYSGTALKEINDYVVNGDVILSGDIIHNEEVKEKVCANGVVYGEVWYKVKVSVPFEEEIINYTGKNRYNIGFALGNKKYSLFRSRIKNKKEEETNLYKLYNFEISLIKEKEYEKNIHKLGETEAYNKAIKIAEEKIKMKLHENEEILMKKVLKKETFDSKIYLEVFIVAKENIGRLVILKEE